MAEDAGAGQARINDKCDDQQRPGGVEQDDPASARNPLMKHGHEQADRQQIAQYQPVDRPQPGRPGRGLPAGGRIRFLHELGGGVGTGWSHAAHRPPAYQTLFPRSRHCHATLRMVRPASHGAK